MNHLTALPALSAEKEASLVLAAQAGDQDAMSTLICSQLRYLRKEAARRSRRNAAEVDDLVQEGVMALIAAVERHNPERGRLWTSARRDIAKAMAGATATANLPVAIPTSTIQQYWKAVRSTEALEDARAWFTSPERGTMRMDAATFDSIHKVVSRQSMEPGSSPFGGVVVSRKFSGSARTSEGGGFQLHDKIAAPEAEARLATVEDRDDAQRRLAILTERERRVLEMANGFDGEPMTDGAIATVLGIDRTRVVRIRQAAIRKLQVEAGVTS